MVIDMQTEILREKLTRWHSLQTSPLRTGIDIVAISRLDQAIRRYSQRILARLFTPHEQIYAQSQAHPIRAYAKRFAAKEAFCKAAGLGIGAELSWRDIQVSRTKRGAPFLEIQHDAYGRVCNHLQHRFAAEVSLSDDQEWACASVILWLKA